MENNIKKVYVIHKTHLDIGFTALAQDVLDTYLNNFIPKAIEVANECNKNGEKNFVWTVGSYLIKYYLENSNNPQPLIDAINKGYIAWHGLPVTTHTELLDKDLMDYAISISQDLNKQFSKTTIAAKMTDVPGHTTALVPYLQNAGIKYLHIGINESSKPMDIPELCILKYKDSKVILNYASDYGQVQILGDVALEFAHTSDNMGPPTAEGVFLEIERLQKKYKNAQIVSSTLDEFANEVLKVADTLPVVEAELGDTWIHGASTDPYKIAMFRELLKIKNSIPDFKNTPEYDIFMSNLLLIAEHTCGLDTKVWLYDYKNWDKKSFFAARKKDKTTMEDLTPSGDIITKFVLKQFGHYTDGKMLGSYNNIEKSWEEQREYLDKAISVLPTDVQAQVAHIKAKLMPQTKPTIITNITDNILTVNNYNFKVLNNGTIKLLKDNKGKIYKNAFMGDMTYAIYSAKTVTDCYENYNVNISNTFGWSNSDFSKPGLDNVVDLVDVDYKFTLLNKNLTDNILTLHLEAPTKAQEEYGCPKEAFVRYEFLDEQIKINLSWFDKDANRLPEAIYFGFNFDFDESLTAYKLDLPIKPYDVVSNGNRKLHAVQKIVQDNVIIENTHSPLVCFGGKNVFDTTNSYYDITNGINAVLYNNRWNTNFRLWYQENASFDFTIIIS